MPIERDLGHFKSRHSENSIRQQFQLWINDVDDALRVPCSFVMNKLAKLIDSISFTISSSIDSRKFFFFLSKLRLNSRKMAEEAVYTPVLSRPNYVSFHRAFFFSSGFGEGSRSLSAASARSRENDYISPAPSK